ncbi:myotubularin-related protein 14-like isoform X2 [Stegodyphus dumicola]|uniref:myotubularin-related protein 14-like isoform X2 n=1 Tax=Stegodyphus dumicola TaxID=202533 RepID=UPI0015AC8C72|nr:myotubularin-related protein 14-like isoform X2 [Stegodyphus dumicola]
MGRMCVTLFERDYICDVRRNRFGSLCPGYPGFIVIPLKEKAIGAPTPSPESRLSDFNGEEWAKEVKDCRLVRRKKRFPLPVILCQGKYVCRSAALQDKVTKAWHHNFGRGKSVKFQEEMKRDVKLLKDFGVGYICDFRNIGEVMKSDENASAPENHYLHLYEEFETLRLPYQGAYHFREFLENTKVEKLKFYCDWSKRGTAIRFPVDVKVPGMDISKCQLWTALEITQNYLLLLLTCIMSEKKGILINSHNGLDRTPLFVCLLRLSLWADGLIHQSLNPLEMAFLTVSYDWHLCGHDLQDRMFQKYLIMLFCFKCLEHISSDRFSMKKFCEQSSQGESSESNSPASEREEKLAAVQEIFLELYKARSEEMKADIKRGKEESREFVKLIRDRKRNL